MSFLTAASSILLRRFSAVAGRVRRPGRESRSCRAERSSSFGWAARALVALGPLLISAALLSPASVLARAQGGGAALRPPDAAVELPGLAAIGLEQASSKRAPTAAMVASWWLPAIDEARAPHALLSTAAAAQPDARLPRPVATEVPLNRSLTRAVRDGLLIRYSVNQQVAGQFEVMIATQRARQLHIVGFRARHLPKGYAPQTVIAMHLLVTMRASRGRLRIQFPPLTRPKLQRLHRLHFTVRLIVRNASRQAPKATLVQTAVTLLS